MDEFICTTCGKTFLADFPKFGEKDPLCPTGLEEEELACVKAKSKIAGPDGKYKFTQGEIDYIYKTVHARHIVTHEIVKAAGPASAASASSSPAAAGSSSQAAFVKTVVATPRPAAYAGPSLQRIDDDEHVRASGLFRWMLNQMKNQEGHEGTGAYAGDLQYPAPTTHRYETPSVIKIAEGLWAGHPSFAAVNPHSLTSFKDDHRKVTQTNFLIDRQGGGRHNIHVTHAEGREGAWVAL